MSLLIEVLTARGLSGGDAKRALKTGKVHRRGVPTADGGQEVDPAEIELRERAPRLSPGRDLAIIHRDEHVAIVWKPSGLLSVSAPGRAREDNLVGLCARFFGEAHPVHRLDEDTSGLMLVALNEVAQTAVKDLLAERKIERRYLALVWGHYPEQRSYRSRLGRRQDGRRGSVPDQVDGKDAVTHVECLERLPRGVSLVRVTLETGRTHQIRIHLAEDGHAVLSDPLYGRRNDRLCRRLALHASELRLTHPLTRKELHVDAGLADDLEKFRRWLASNPPPGKVRTKRRRR